MKHLPTSLHPPGKPPRKPWSLERQVYSYRNFRDSERIDRIWNPAPGRRTGALGDGVHVWVPLIPYTLHRLQAREGACGGWGAELKPWASGNKVEGWDIEWMEVVRDK